MPTSPSRGRGFPLVVAGSFASMETQLDNMLAAGHLDVVGQLHTAGVVGPNSLIAEYERETGGGGFWKQKCTAKLSRVTTSLYGLQDAASAVAGLTRTMAPGHTLPAAGVLTAWDVSGSVEIAPGVAFSVVGDVVTFDVDPGASATGDLFILDGNCEFGNLRETGLWIPRDGTLCVFDATSLAITTANDVGACCIFTPGLGSGMSTTHVSLELSFLVDFAEALSPGGYFSFGKVGDLGAANRCNTLGLYDDAGVIKKALIYGTISGPIVSGPAPLTGALDGLSDIRVSTVWLNNGDVLATVATTLQLIGTGITESLPINSSGFPTAAVVFWDKVDNGVIFHAHNAGGTGTLRVKEVSIKRFLQ